MDIRRVHNINESYDSFRERRYIRNQQNEAMIILIAGFVLTFFSIMLLSFDKIPPKYYAIIISTILFGIFLVYIGFKLMRKVESREIKRKKREWH